MKNLVTKPGGKVEQVVRTKYLRYQIRPMQENLTLSAPKSGEIMTSKNVYCARKIELTLKHAAMKITGRYKVELLLYHARRIFHSSAYYYFEFRNWNPLRNQNSDLHSHQQCSMMPAGRTFLWREKCLPLGFQGNGLPASDEKQPFYKRRKPLKSMRGGQMVDPAFRQMLPQLVKF